MKIAIDLQACQTESSANRGIGRYSMALIQAINRQKLKNDKIIGIANSSYGEKVITIKKELEDIDIITYKYPALNYSYGEKNDFKREIASKLILQKYKQIEADVIYISSIFEGMIGKSVVPKPLKLLDNKLLVATIYDLIPLLMPKIYLSDKFIRKWYYDCMERVKQCDILFAISEATRQDIIKYLDISPNKVININGAVDDKFKKINIKNESYFKRRYNIEKSFIMYTGGIDYRKNIDGLIRSYARLSEDLKRNFQLVIVCSVKEDQKNQLLNLASNLGISKNRIIFTGFVLDEDLVKLYNLCDLFVFPSRYEGFGLPILEAMNCGAPVIGADNSSIAEIIVNKEALFNADNIKDIAKKITDVLENDDLRNRLCKWSEVRSKDFNWDKSAQIVLETLREKIKERKSKRENFLSVKTVDRLKKIAYMTPLPPQKSGIAIYSAELLPELDKYFDIDIFTDAEICNDLSLKSRFGIYNFKDFEKKSDKYEIIIYQMGNSSFHTYMYKYIMKYSGIVVQHDFYLSGLINYMNNNDKDSKDIFINTLFYSHGLKGYRYLKKKGFQNTYWSYPMNKELLDNIQGMIVHSKYSMELYNKFYGNEINIPIKCINQIRKEVKSINKNKKITKQELCLENEFLIVSFGFLSETKLDHLIIEAFKILLNKINERRIKLIFVGSVSDAAYNGFIKKLVEEKNLENVIITGFVDNEKYNKYLEIADIAIQLRCKSRGETSRAVLDCLAYGVPTIVNDYATFRDYPDDVVYKMSSEPSVEDIEIAMEYLYFNETVRKKYSDIGPKYIKENHNIAIIAEQYAKFINEIIAKDKYDNKNVFINEVAECISGYSYTKHDLLEIVRAYEKNHKKYHIKRVLCLINDELYNLLKKDFDDKFSDIVNIEICKILFRKNKINTEGIDIRVNENDVLISEPEYINQKLIEFVIENNLNLYICVEDFSKIKIIDKKYFKYIVGGLVFNNLDINIKSHNIKIYDIDKIMRID